MNIMKSSLMFSSNNCSAYLGLRSFSSRVFQSGDDLKDNFSFPKHKEFFNDKFYEEPNENTGKSPYAKNAAGPQTLSEDYVDPNNPFLSESPFVPGGILSSYKKRAGLTADDVME